MGFDFDRSEVENEASAEPYESAVAAPDQSVFELVNQALKQNLVAERFAIDAYRKIAAHGENYDRATMRLVEVALAVEEEHAEILSGLIADLALTRQFSPRA
jgi:bacterioferritin (cytochrome b1)